LLHWAQQAPLAWLRLRRHLSASPAPTTASQRFKSIEASSCCRTRHYVTVVEGTNIAAAVSPDGKTVAFDLYGILWLVGVRVVLLRGLTDDFADIAQPDWSPDGNTLAFQSYRDGNFHLWSIAADGTGGNS